MHNIISTRSTDRTQQWMLRVFSWMFAGLLMTGIIAYALSLNTHFVKYLVQSDAAFYGIVGANFLIVVGLYFLMNKLSPFMVTFGFFVYAALNGVTMTLILHYYEIGTIFSAFFITAGMFGFFAMYGYVTKRDLSKIGSIAIMFAIGIIIASLVNIFYIKNGMAELIISYALVALFCVITAYDIQWIRGMADEELDDDEAEKMAIYGALALYLDFIIIFKRVLYILNDD